MNEVLLGPVVISSVRFSAAVGLLVFVLVAEIAARRQPGLSTWAMNSVWVILLGSRLGFVLENLDVFRLDPLSALYFWQGGFSPFWGLAGAALYTFFSRVSQTTIPLAAIGLLAWGGAVAFTSDRDQELTQLPNLKTYP